MRKMCYTPCGYNAAMSRGSNLLPLGDISQAHSCGVSPLSSQEDSQCQDMSCQVTYSTRFVNDNKTTPARRIVLPTSLYVDYADLLGGRKESPCNTVHARRTKNVKAVRNRVDYWRLRGATSDYPLVESLLRLLRKVRRDAR